MSTAHAPWRIYRVRCHVGASTTLLMIFECWARDVDHAFEMARGSGYIPVSLF